MLTSDLSLANLRGDFSTIGSDLSPHGRDVAKHWIRKPDVMG
jgi:hypothetical protein